MDLTRRSFLEDAAVAGTFASLLSGSVLAQSRVEPSQGKAIPAVPSNIPQHGASEYWTQFYGAVDPTLPKSRGPRVKVPPSERQVMFLQSGANGLRYLDDVNEDELLDYAGDVQVSMALGQFRPGTGDQDYLKHVQSSQLRVDCVQNKPYRELLAPLAWCAMASLKTNQAGKLPSLASLGFNAPNAMSGVTKILLPGGIGKIAVNIYVTKGESIIQRIIKEAVQIAPLVAPVMNFPAISVPALRAFADVFGALEERASFIMTSQLTDAVATKQALADPDRGVTYLHLVPGDYVLVPQAHIDELKPQLPNLQVQQGYLVSKNASQSDPVEARADQAVPGVSYATLKISVAAATSSGTSTPGGATDDSGNGGSGAKKKTGGKS